MADLRRALPHDLTNGLAAAALVLETGLVGPDAVAAGLASFVGPPHRIELVGEADGVRWYNDSKATTPHAASVAIRAFDHVVLIAGGLNKGLDLAPMAAEAGAADGRRRHRRGRRRRRRHVRRRRAGRDARPRWPRPSSGPARRPGPATSCCCRRGAPASTGTPTAGTRRAATTSAASSTQRLATVTSGAG